MASRKILSFIAIFTLLAVLAISTFATQAQAAVSWQVTITASCQGYSSETILGVASDATDGFDTSPAYDALLPPDPPPPSVVSSFYYPSNPAGQRSLTTSIIPESPSMTWTLRVVPHELTGDMQLSWTDIPSGYSGYIKDSTGAITYADMSVVSQYTYSATEEMLVVFQVNLVIPEYPLGIMLALTVCFASYGILKIRKYPKPF